MNQAMQDQLRIMLRGPVAMVGGRCLAHLVVNGLMTRGLAEATRLCDGKPAARITRRGIEVLQRTDPRRIRCQA